MQTLDSRDSYGAIARWLHWTMFALIAVQIAGGIFLEDLPKGSALRGLAFDGHETAGIVAILLVLARVAWKLSHPVPAPANHHRPTGRPVAHGHPADGRTPRTCRVPANGPAPGVHPLPAPG